MSEWKRVKLGEVAGIQSGPFGSQLHESDYVTFGGTPIVTVEHLGRRHFTTQNLPLVSDADKERLSRYVMKYGDVIFSRVGSVDRCSFVDHETDGWMFSGRCIRIRPNDSVEGAFLYYYLSLPSVKQLVRDMAVGTTMPSINSTIMGDVPISLPPLATQRKIAAVLGALDDKIENNRKICANLEAQAQALFKSWFVDFEPFGCKMPSGWKMGKLGEIADITMGQSPDGKSLNENDDGITFFQGRAEFGCRYPTKRLSTTEPKRMAKMGDVLLSVRAPVGDLNIALEDCCIGRGLAAIRSKLNAQSFMYYLLKTKKPEFDLYEGAGTIFGSINKDSLHGLLAFSPDVETLGRFEDLASSFDKMYHERELESRALAATRDALLPKLMSGEIDVEKVEV